MNTWWNQFNRWPIWHIFGIYDGRIVILGAFFVWIGIHAINTGVAWEDYGEARKDKEPGRFRFDVITSFIIGGMAILYGLLGPLLASKP